MVKIPLLVDNESVVKILVKILSQIKFRSDLEYEFACQWEETYPDIDLHHDYPFAKPIKRKFLADFCHPEARVIIEVQGGTWVPEMGHSSAKSIQRDYEKFCIAASLGYLVFPLTNHMVQDQHLTWIRLIATAIMQRI